MTISNLKHKYIDFDFVELRFAPVLRMPLTLKGAKKINYFRQLADWGK